MPAPASLSRARILLYALPALASSVATLPMALSIPAYYAGDLGVPLAAVGRALAGSRPIPHVGLAGGGRDRRRHLASGSERSGLFFAVWGMATKLSQALGVL